MFVEECLSVKVKCTYMTGKTNPISLRKPHNTDRHHRNIPTPYTQRTYLISNLTSFFKRTQHLEATRKQKIYFLQIFNLTKQLLLSIFYFIEAEIRIKILPKNKFESFIHFFFHRNLQTIPGAQEKKKNSLSINHIHFQLMYMIAKSTNS